MEAPHSVSIPRRICNLLGKKGPRVCLVDSENKASGFGVSGEHGPKTSEVYGFVGSITTSAATVIFPVRAYATKSWRHTIGISYCRSRYWAPAIPVYVMVAMLLALGFYIELHANPSSNIFKHIISFGESGLNSQQSPPKFHLSFLQHISPFLFFNLTDCCGSSILNHSTGGPN